MKNSRRGMALPAAIAAMIILAGVSALANLSATAAIRESRAMREVAAERALWETLRARTEVQLDRRGRATLLGASIPIGFADTLLTVAAMSWPWHKLVVTVGGEPAFAEFARARVPNVPWCNNVAYAGVATIAPGTLEIPFGSTCPDRIAIGTAFYAAFDSALVADIIGLVPADSLRVAGSLSGIARASRVEIDGTARVSGIIIAPVVRIASGAVVRGIVITRDSIVVAGGASVIADYSALTAALVERARIQPLGRRGMIILP